MLALLKYLLKHKKQKKHTIHDLRSIVLSKVPNLTHLLPTSNIYFHDSQFSLLLKIYWHMAQFVPPKISILKKRNKERERTYFDNK